MPCAKLSPKLIALIQTLEQYEVAAIDGGGALGCGSSLYMSKLWTEFHIKFKAYVGSSVGSLLTLLYASGYGYDESDVIFMNTVNSIFAKPGIMWHCDPTRPKYDSINLEAACVKYFGTKKMTDLKDPVFITTADFAEGKAKIWDNSDDVSIVEVIMCSTAAPTYFAPRNSRYGDGGLVANNPSVVGIAGLKKSGVPIDKIKMLSLASGGSFWKNPKVGGRMLELQWVKPLISFMLDGNEERDEFVAQEILGNSYLRIKPNETSSFDMDDLTKLEAWRALWSTAYDNTKQETAKLLGVKTA